jgi:NitT/TauT family transport system substrate-binding protein
MAADKVRFAIPSRSVSIMPVFIASKEGFYRKEGMELEIIHMSSRLAVTATIAGSVDFSSIPGPAINAVIRGADLRIILVVGQRPLHDLITHPSVRSFEQLKGKIIGVTSLGSMSDTLTRKILRKNSLEPDRDVAIRAIGTETLQLTALKNEITSGALLTVPYNFLAQKDGFYRLAYAGDYEEVIIGGVVTTGKLLKTEPGKALRFLRATLRGLQFYRDHKGESLHHMGEFLQIKDSRFLGDIYNYHLTTLTKTGSISSALMVRLIDDARQFAKVEKEVKKEEVFDFSLVEKVAGEVR